VVLTTFFRLGDEVAIILGSEGNLETSKVVPGFWTWEKVLICFGFLFQLKSYFIP
jgi:hypothetical protein